jgi:purine nucleoside phosphorylase
MAAGMGQATLDHREVEQTANATREVFMKLLANWIGRIAA